MRIDENEILVESEVDYTFKVLGPLFVRVNGRACTPSASKVRQVLALSLFRVNQIVSLDAMIEELWGDRPPRTAATIVQTYIYQLRKILARCAGVAAANATIHTAPPGYVLSVPVERVDCHQFEIAVRRGQTLLEQGQARQAETQLSQALGMWNGAVLVNTEHGSLLSGDVAQLEEKRMLALELRLRANMQLGRHREILAELKSLVAAHPFNEWLHGQLMVALYRSGRRGEALAAYQTARKLLDDELGLEPSADLRRIHQELLNTDVECLSGMHGRLTLEPVRLPAAG
ncbi:MAG TPA: AfsR/SARP family transcriptional regulator [Pseudonocardiaceae bacterium]|nr:AfsR/SARP family transcriptional regulator [Pseudonocardiaceae bacterium]